MTFLMSGLANDFNKAGKTKSNERFFVSECSELSKLKFMSPTIQTNPGRLPM